jgi:hypothetical protein
LPDLVLVEQVGQVTDMRALHPEVPRPTDDELVDVAIHLLHAISMCGNTPEVATAELIAHDLMAYLRKPRGYSNFRQRVEHEKAELDDKIYRLSVFINSPNFNTIDPEERVRLHTQLMIMVEYSRVLLSRIAAF